eukprot:g26491.t1
MPSTGEEAPGRCPRDIEELLFEVFNDFRRRRPWISPQFLRPKGIALELLSCESYKELQDRLPNLPEGTLLRYLSDVYRALRLGMPDEMKTTGLRQVENRLRQTVLQADSSLISEWEALKNFEKNIEALDSIEVLEDIEIDAGDLKGGSMVPATSRDVARRSREELQQRLQTLGDRVASARLNTCVAEDGAKTPVTATCRARGRRNSAAARPPAARQAGHHAALGRGGRDMAEVAGPRVVRKARQ